MCVCVLLIKSGVVLESLQSSGTHSIADAMGSVFFAIAAGAINFVVLPVVQIGRVQRTVAIATVETATMPHLYRRNLSVSNKLKIARNTQVTYSVLANHLLGGVDGESATRTAFTLRGF